MAAGELKRWCFSYTRHFIVTVLIVSACDGVNSIKNTTDIRTVEQSIMTEILNSDYYSTNMLPNDPDVGPTVVEVNIFVRNVEEISDINMEWRVQITLRQKWNDPRLRYDDMQGRIKHLTLGDTSQVWIPDLFFKNEKAGHFHNIIVPNLYVRIFPNGDVIYSTRLTLTLPCPMDLKLFPMDTQQCMMSLASYAMTTRDVVFTWKERSAVQISPRLHLAMFTVESFVTDYCNSKSNTGEYSCLYFSVVFKRRASHYIIQYYVPLAIMVTVAYLALWLDATTSSGRVLLAIVSLITIITLSFAISFTVPPVSYSKAIDIWSGVCCIFAFGALVETVVVSGLVRAGQRKSRAAGGVADQGLKEARYGGAEGAAVSRLPGKDRMTKASEWLDIVSRIAYLTLFVAFVIGYFLTYTLPEEELIRTVQSGIRTDGTVQSGIRTDGTVPNMVRTVHTV